MVCGLNGFQMDKESLKEHLAMEKEIINGLSWYKNGNKKLEANYKNGKLNGMWISWYENGIIKEKSGYYSDNKLDKQWTYWAEDGRKTNETTYEKGKKVVQ